MSNKSTRTFFYSASCICIASIVIWFGAVNNSVEASSDKGVSEGGTVFPGTGTGAIPDGDTGCGIPSTQNLDITFNVAGVSSISDVEVEMDIDHTWMGDITATLIAPSGESHVLFQNTGWTDVNSSCGYAGNLGGVYRFSDSATGTNWWTVAETLGDDDILPAGDYRTTEPGGDSQTQDPAPVTLMTPPFASAGTINGNWTLRVNDANELDPGTVNAANLTLNSSLAPSTQPPQNDFDGDGKSDYSIVRDNTPAVSESAPAGRRSIQELQNDRGFKPLKSNKSANTPENHGTNLGWYIHNSGNNTARVQGHGDPLSDFWVPEDYDGDGQDDIAVWRGVAPAGPMGGFFYTFTSSNNTVNEIDFGIQGDNPTVVGDYDGDGLADPAVYRCPPFPPGGQCTFFFQGSAGNGDITYFPWGEDSVDSIRPYPGDFDGDGLYDFCIWQDGIYSLFRSSDSGTEFIQWGLTSDPVIAPGDYDGDGKTDFMNVRVNGSQVEWWLLDRNGGQNTFLWGAIIAGFGEFITPADFDGDGTTDVSVWRRDNASNSNSFFYTLRSSDSQLQTFEWGSMLDAPVPGWNTQ